MTIDELIQPLKKSNAFEQFIQNNRTKRELNELGKTVPGWKILCYMLERCNTDFALISKFEMAYDPQNIIALCNKLNIQTDQELYKWIEAMNNISIDGMIDAFHPTITLTDYVETDFETIIRAVKTQCLTINLKVHNQLDEKYIVPHSYDVKHILLKSPCDRMKYIPERRDCDDYAIMFKGWLAECGYGNLSFPIAICNCYQDDKLIFAHALNVIISHIDKNFKCEFLEPQTDKIWNPIDPMVMGTEKFTIKIREIML